MLGLQGPQREVGLCGVCGHELRCSLETLTQGSEDLLEIGREVCDPNKVERHILVRCPPCPLVMALWAQQHGGLPPEEERSPLLGYPLGHHGPSGLGSAPVGTAGQRGDL